MRFIVTLLLILPLIVYADTGNVSYIAPTEREDNTPLLPSEIGGFRVYDNAGNIIMELAAAATSFTVPAQGQTLYLTCFDTDGRESSFSQAINIPVSETSPKAPTIIEVFITTGSTL